MPIIEADSDDDIFDELPPSPVVVRERSVSASEEAESKSVSAKVRRDRVNSGKSATILLRSQTSQSARDGKTGSGSASENSSGKTSGNNSQTKVRPNRVLLEYAI